MSTQNNGWDSSATGWLAAIGEHGDFSRQHVLDGPMMARAKSHSYRNALDIGSGEGRFCRMLRDAGLDPIGIEPTAALRDAAQARDPAGRYLDAKAENLPFEDSSFDLVVSYLTLIDIDEIEIAISEMARVLRPGGALLIANLNSFATAGSWRRREDGTDYFVMDNYLEARAEWASWSGITVRNWHRPFSFYVQLLLASGLQLTHFDEPEPQGGGAFGTKRYRRMPFHHVMEWIKPGDNRSETG